MTNLLVGSNFFQDCENAILLAGKPLFSYEVEADGVSLCFNLASPPARTGVEVVRNKVVSGDVKVLMTPNSTAVAYEDKTIIEVASIESKIVVRLDLRSLGVRLYTDHSALYVGESQFSRNSFRKCKVGIAVG